MKDNPVKKKENGLEKANFTKQNQELEDSLTSSTNLEDSSTILENKKGEENGPDFTKINQGTQPNPSTKEGDLESTKQNQGFQEQEKVNTNLEEPSTNLEDKKGEENGPDFTKINQGTQPNQGTKEPSYHKKNYGQSDLVEKFFQHLGKSEAGSALKMIEADKVVILDKDTFDSFSKKHAYLLGNHELLARLCDVLHPFVNEILEKTEKLKGKNVFQLTGYITKQVPYYMEMGKRLRAEMDKNSQLLDDFNQFNELMSSLSDSGKEERNRVLPQQNQSNTKLL